MGSNRVLKENMVLNIEPLIIGGGVTPWWHADSRFGVEDTVRITDGDPENTYPLRNTALGYVAGLLIAYKLLFGNGST